MEALMTAALEGAHEHLVDNRPSDMRNHGIERAPQRTPTITLMTHHNESDLDMTAAGIYALLQSSQVDPAQVNATSQRAIAYRGKSAGHAHESFVLWTLLQSQPFKGTGSFEDLVSVVAEFLMDFGDLDKTDQNGDNFQALGVSRGGILTIRQEHIHNAYERCPLVITHIKGLNLEGKNRLAREMRRITSSQLGPQTMASGSVNLMLFAVISTLRREGKLFTKLINNTGPSPFERSLRSAQWMSDSQRQALVEVFSSMVSKTSKVFTATYRAACIAGLSDHGFVKRTLTMATELCAEFYRHADSQSVRTEHVVKHILGRIRGSSAYLNQNETVSDSEMRINLVDPHLRTVTVRAFAEELISQARPRGVRLPTTFEFTGRDGKGAPFPPKTVDPVEDTSFDLPALRAGDATLSVAFQALSQEIAGQQTWGQVSAVWKKKVMPIIDHYTAQLAALVAAVQRQRDVPVDMLAVVALIEAQTDTMAAIFAPCAHLYSVAGRLPSEVVYTPKLPSKGEYAVHHFFPNYSGREEQRQGANEIAKILGIDRVPDALLVDFGVALWNEAVPDLRTSHIEWHSVQQPPNVMTRTLSELVESAVQRVGVESAGFAFPARTSVPGTTMRPRFMHHGWYVDEDANGGFEGSGHGLPCVQQPFEAFVKALEMTLPEWVREASAGQGGSLARHTLMQHLFHLPPSEYKADELCRKVSTVTGHAAITPEVVTAYADRIAASSLIVGGIINKRLMVALHKQRQIQGRSSILHSLGFAGPDLGAAYIVTAQGLLEPAGAPDGRWPDEISRLKRLHAHADTVEKYVKESAYALGCLGTAGLDLMERFCRTGTFPSEQEILDSVTGVAGLDQDQAVIQSAEDQCVKMADAALSQMFDKDDVSLPNFFANNHGAVRVKRCPPSMSTIRRDMMLPAAQPKVSEVEKIQPEEKDKDD